MKVMKTLRNILGTVGLIYAGYVLVVSMKDVRRYIKNQHHVNVLCGADTLSAALQLILRLQILFKPELIAADKSVRPTGTSEK